MTMVMAVPKMDKSPLPLRERVSSPGKPFLPRRKEKTRMIMVSGKPKRGSVSGSSGEADVVASSPQLPRIGHPPLTRKLSNRSTMSTDSASGHTVDVVGSAARRLSRRGSFWGRSMLSLGQKNNGGRRKVFYSNTYKTEPDEDIKFKPFQVKMMLDSTLEHYLNEVRYDQQEAKALSSKLSEVIRHRVKCMDFKRHKIVVNVMIGELKNQGMKMVSRCIWDSNNDNFATTCYKNTSLFAIASVYGVYFE